MRALIAVLCWLALSGPLALLVSRLIGTAGSDDVGDEAERWLRSLVPPRHRLRDAVLRSALAVIVLAPVAVGALVAVWRLPDAVTFARADGQLALSWPPGQPDETTTTTSPDAAVPAETGGATGAASASVASASPEPTMPDESPPATPTDPATTPGAGGGDTGAPALAEPDDDEARHDDERCDGDGSKGHGGPKDDTCDEPHDDSSGPGDGGDDPGDDGGEGSGPDESTTTTTEPPEPSDDDPAAPIPYRSSTALATGVR